MADPFSVAGSVVGVVSLGLTVCQGIVTFCTAYKGQNEELDHIHGKVLHLRSLLAGLQPLLESRLNAYSDVAGKVEVCVHACSRAIHKLEDAWKKCDHAASSNGFRATGRKLVFPLKRDALESLKSGVNEFQRNLNTAFHVLEIENKDEISRQVSNLSRSNNSILQNTFTMRNDIDELKNQVLAMVPTYTQISTRQKFQGSLSNPNNIQPETMPLEVRSDAVPLCTCRRRREREELVVRIGPVVFHRTRNFSALHSGNCPLQGQYKFGLRYGINFRLGTSSRAWSVDAALNFNRALGTFSVGPSLLLRAVVPSDHPSFKKIREGMELVEEEGDASIYVDTLWSLLRMFKIGEAAPNDVQSDGSTLIHTIMGSGALLLFYAAPVQAAKIRSAFLKLLLGLIDAGVPINELDGSGTHAVRGAVVAESWQEGDGFLLDAISTEMKKDEEDFDVWKHVFTYDIGTSWKPQSIFSLFRKDLELSAHYENNDLGRAILSMRICDVDRLLEENPKAIFHRNTFKQTVLHLASGWPDGMGRLLETGARYLVDTRDFSGALPLEYAFWYSCRSTIDMLLEADSYIDWRIITFIRRYESLISNISGILFQHLANRRHRLKMFAKQNLSTEEFKSLDIPAENPMDGPCTLRVSTVLEAHFVDIPKALEFPGPQDPWYREPCSMFSPRLRLTAKMAENMWEAGFRPDFQEDSLGSILSFCERDESLDFILWAQSKVISISDTDFHEHMTGIRSWNVQPSEQISKFLYPLPIRMRLYGELFSSRQGLEHGCMCSLDTCFPALTTTKLPPRFLGEDEIYLSGLRLAESMKDHIDDHYWTWLAPSMIRCCLFDAMKLTHTLECCKNNNNKYFSRKPMDQKEEEWYLRKSEETKELPEEEWYLRKRFHRLSQELIAEYDPLAMPLSTFLEECVLSRAQLVLEGEIFPRKQDKEKLREVGVVLEVDSDG